MAIIIDTNCLANVFVRNSQKHNEFRPVLDWIIKGKGILIFGGTKYMHELNKAKRYLTIINLLKDCKKVHIGSKENIDRIQREIESKNKDANFDDPHLPAIVIETKCKLICSEDVRAIPYVRNRKWYPEHVDIPCFYTGSRNADLLCDQYVDESHKPLCKINKQSIEKITNTLEK